MSVVVVRSAAGNLAELLGSVGRQIGYLIFWEKYVEDLREQLKKLLEARERDEVDITEARRNGKEIVNDVQYWLSSVDEIIEMAEKLFEDASHAKTKFCNSPFFHHQLRRKARKITNDASELQAQGVFACVSRLPISSFPDDLKEFEWRMPIFYGVMEAIEDPNIQVIGIGGMPGVGKTTLIKQIAKQAKTNRLFDRVVMAVVSAYPDVRRIQHQIADMLGLNLTEKSTTVRACRFYKRLNQEERLLIILDDVWYRLDLGQIGIPKGLKIVLTSRDQNVLHQMEAQKIFCVEPLLHNEAVSFFLKFSGITDDVESHSDPRYRELAVDIAHRCGGLPVLLEMVARGLKNKTYFQWKDTLKQLERYDGSLCRDVVFVLKMSYEYLLNEAKLMFLLCAALGEEIFSQQLLKLCLGLGLFKHIYTVEEARWRMVRLIHDLKGLYLLQDGKTSNSVTMNVAIRSAALQIASEEYNMFVVPDGYEESMWTSDENPIQNFTALFLLGNHRGVPERLACPKLKLFHVYDESCTVAIPSHFFEGMHRELKVLSLINMKLASLPSSIRVLTSIHTLCLEKCELDDIALLGELISLKVLSLAGSNIEQLPCQVRGLVNLCFLDLSNCSKLKTIPPFVLSNLKRLEALLLPNCFGQWQHYERSKDGRTNASLGELTHLNHLEVLDIHIPDIKVLPQDLAFHKLQRYNISIGQLLGQHSGKFERNLQLNLTGADSTVHGLVKPLLGKSEELWLQELKGFKSIHELDPEGFLTLKHLHIQDMAEMEYIANSSYLNAPIVHSFNNLRVVKVERCNKLEFLFSSSMCRGLSRLTEMEISECSMMGSILRGHEEDAELRSIQGCNMMLFRGLRSLTLQNLPKLIGFVTMEVAQKQSLNSCALLDKVVFPNLENLQLSGLGALTYIWKDHGFDLEMLKSLSLFECSNLKYLFSPNAVSALSHLQELTITSYKSNLEVQVIDCDPWHKDHDPQNSIEYLFIPSF
ncbi:hypothetical protein L6164_012996 [Bauhinia variegata]|uniref:Uncharacterized protein n=1 Tax=Bauhinia variegata TaxID=167791 RepID=A0ACB9PB02_BAUVA|nr:hypothetical protein L6164_012996 [Bauhinia variegata]